MGVKGLWRLLLPIGRRISIETLEGRILAIDASIWLTQFIKAMRDPDTGQVQAAAHLIGFFRRLCRLRFHNIKPVLVFDGATPEIKKRETALRRQRREQFASLGDASVQKLARKLLAETLKLQKAQQQQQQQQQQRNNNALAGDENENAGAFAPGFRLPQASCLNNNNTSNDSSRISNTIDTSSQQIVDVDDVADSTTNNNFGATNNRGFKRKRPFSTNASGKKVTFETVFSDENTSEAYIDAALSSSNSQDFAMSSSENVNDFTGEVNDWDEEANQSGGVNERTSSSLSFAGRDNNNNNNIDECNAMTTMAQLPANERKDAMEAAQRQQRLRSRREYMPVAAQPQQFSQVQLVNFLRSTKLKKHYVKQVTSTTSGTGNNKGSLNNGADNELDDDSDSDGGFDDFMASDRTRRIILEREEPAKNKKGLRKFAAKRPRFAHKFSHDNSSDDENGEQEFGWQNGDDDSNKDQSSQRSIEVLNNSASVKKKGIQAIVDSDSSIIDSSSSDDDIDAVKPHILPVLGNAKVNVAALAALDDSDGDDFDSKEAAGQAGFFGIKDSQAHGDQTRIIPHGNKHVAMKHAVLTKREKVALATNNKSGTKNDSEVIVLDDNSSESSVGGGFIRQNVCIDNVTDERSNRNKTDLSLTNESVKDSKGTENSLLGNVIVLADHYDESDLDDGGFIRSGKVSEAASIHESSQGNYAQDKGKNMTLTSKSDEIVAQVIQDAMLARALQGMEDSDESIEVELLESHLKIKPTPISTSIGVDKSNHLQKQNPSLLPSGETAQKEDVSEDENLDWEDGESDNIKVDWEDGTTANLPKSNQGKSNNEAVIATSSTANDPVDSKATDNLISLLNDKDPQNQDENLDILDDDYKDDSSLSSDRNSNSNNDNILSQDDFDAPIAHDDGYENAAALERAEAAACNLAQWAGRAFRRAMKEAGVTDLQRSPEAKRSFSSEMEVIDTTPEKASSVVKGTPHSASIERHDSESVPEIMEANASNSFDKAESFDKSESVDKTETFDNNIFGSGFDELRNEKREAILREFDTEGSQERNQRERDMDTITDVMKEEAMKLLQLFGVPYIEAPTEAEAQCAALEAFGLVDGIVTEDSDVFVFGGKTVYKNIFDEKLYTEVYLTKDAEREMGLNHNGMVAMAMLLGSDYTTGVKGVGIVNAMEVLQAFDVSSDLKGGLQRFRQWLDGFDPDELGLKPNVNADNKAAITEEKVFHNKHRTARSRWIPPDNFPADNVIQAYLNPVVDKSRERFSWGVPDVEGLVAFCNRNIGWRGEETLKYLEPVMNKLQNPGLRQTRLDSFMSYKDGIKFADVRSNRLRTVLGLATNERAPSATSLDRRRKKTVNDEEQKPIDDANET